MRGRSRGRHAGGGEKKRRVALAIAGARSRSGRGGDELPARVAESPTKGMTGSAGGTYAAAPCGPSHPRKGSRTPGTSEIRAADAKSIGEKGVSTKETKPRAKRRGTCTGRAAYAFENITTTYMMKSGHEPRIKLHTSDSEPLVLVRRYVRRAPDDAPRDQTPASNTASAMVAGDAVAERSVPFRRVPFELRRQPTQRRTPPLSWICVARMSMPIGKILPLVGRHTGSSPTRYFALVRLRASASKNSTSVMNSPVRQRRR